MRLPVPMKFNRMHKSLLYCLAKNVRVFSHFSLNYDLIDCIDALLCFELSAFVLQKLSLKISCHFSYLLLSAFEFICTAYDLIMC